MFLGFGVGLGGHIGEEDLAGAVVHEKLLGDEEQDEEEVGLAEVVDGFKDIFAGAPDYDDDQDESEDGENFSKHNACIIA